MDDFLWIATNFAGFCIGFFAFLVIVLMSMICIVKFKELINRN